MPDSATYGFVGGPVGNHPGPPGGNGVRRVIRTTVVAAYVLPGALPIRQRAMRLHNLPGIPPETEQPD
jgi:hypothetical protein